MKDKNDESHHYRLHFGLRLFERASAMLMASTWNFTILYGLHDFEPYSLTQRIVILTLITIICGILSWRVVRLSLYEHGTASAFFDKEEEAEDDDDETLVSLMDEIEDRSGFNPSRTVVAPHREKPHVSPRAERIFFRLLALTLALVPAYQWSELAESTTNHHHALMMAVGFTLATVLLAGIAATFNSMSVGILVQGSTATIMAALSLSVSKSWAHLFLLLWEYDTIVNQFLMSLAWTFVVAVFLTRVLGSMQSATATQRGVEFFIEDICAFFLGMLWERAFMSALISAIPVHHHEHAHEHQREEFVSLPVLVCIVYAFVLSIGTYYSSWWFHYYSSSSDAALQRRLLHLVSVSLGAVVGASYTATAAALLMFAIVSIFKSSSLLIYLLFSVCMSFANAFAFWVYSHYVCSQHTELGYREGFSTTEIDEIETL